MLHGKVTPARCQPAIDRPVTPGTATRHHFAWLAHDRAPVIRNTPIGDAAREVAHAVRRDVPRERAHRLGERKSLPAITHLAERRIEVVAPREDATVGATCGLLPLV